MKTLILYYSLGGNTRKIAEMIQQQLGGDIEEIQTVKPYTGSYNSIVDQGQKEVEQGYMPEIRPLKSDITSYDRFILGSPVWWYTFAPAMKAFLHGNDLAGKVIYPFVTNGGWIGHIFEDFQKVCPKADVKKGLNVVFDQNKLRSSENIIQGWIGRIK
jgi:Flavodoxins